MQRSEGHIRTSHAGRLPRLVAESETLPRQVTAVVKKQVEIGIDCVGDGEFWNGRNFQYYTQQLSGVTERPLRPGEKGSGRENTRERDRFPKLYADMDRVGTAFCVPGASGARRGRAARHEGALGSLKLRLLFGIGSTPHCVMADGQYASRVILQPLSGELRTKHSL